MSRALWWRARSLLFVPGDRLDLVRKAARSAADALILDLEDGVARAGKEHARAGLGEAVAAAHAGGKPVLVRVNNNLLELADDLRAAGSAEADGLMVPKVRGTELIEAVQAALAQLGYPEIPVLALVEHPAVLACQADLLGIARAPGVRALALGTEDFTVTLRGVPNAAALLLPCQMLVMAARAAGRQAFAVPGSIAALADRDGWRLAARTAREIGADGGLCIHPEQALALNAAFSPTEREVGWAHRVEAAYQEACRLGRGVTTVDGEMVDAPVVERARAILALLENQDPAS